MPKQAMAQPGAEALMLFDGSEESWRHWQSFGPGTGDFFTRAEEGIVACPGQDQALLYYADAQFGNYVLHVSFRLSSPDDNAGVFVRFRDPSQLWMDLRDKPHIQGNPAWTATYTGFEVQIDDQARPDGQDRHRTGAIYDIPTAPEGGGQSQAYHRPAPLAARQWHTFEITVHDDQYEVQLKVAGAADYQRVSRFANRDTCRGLAPWQDARSGYVGVQAHTGRVAFRDIHIRPIR